MPDFDPTSYKNEFNREHYVSLSVRMAPAEKALITQAAAAANMSLREYILSLIQK